MRDHRPRSIGALAACAAWLVLSAAPSAAATLEVAVRDEQGMPIADVAVYATATDAATSPPVAAGEAVMDQHDQRFNPHMLVVQAGTSVKFPNNDTVSHHVYSFSQAKPFELGLYKGNVYPPVVFDQAGLVVVGCNIHDGMLGYILVVDTPHFALTDERGVARIEVPTGDYSLAAWTPRARPAGLPAGRTVTVAAAGSTAVTLDVGGRLAAAHDHGSSSLSWRHY